MASWVLIGVGVGLLLALVATCAGPARRPKECRTCEWWHNWGHEEWGYCWPFHRAWTDANCDCRRWEKRRRK